MRYSTTAICIFFSLSVIAQHSIAINNVTVVDVLNQKKISGETVLMSDSVITDVFPSGKKKLPANTQIIDGSGKYLMPGLVDAHVHFFLDGSLYTSPDWVDLRKFMPNEKLMEDAKLNMEDFLRRYLQCGITSVIDVGSSFNFLKLRDRYANKYFAPTIYMAGPIFLTLNLEHFSNNENDDFFRYVQTPLEAKAAVRKEIAFHPDLVKIIYIAGDAEGTHKEDSARKFLPVVKAIIEEAHSNNLKVAVHATERICAQLAVEAGCDYLAHGIDDEIISDAFINLLKNKKIAVCQTLNVQDAVYKTLVEDNGYAAEEIRHSNPYSFSSLFQLQDIDTALAETTKRLYLSNKPIFSIPDSIRMVNAKKMSDGGITIVGGTDAGGGIGSLHASFYLRELLSMHHAGLSNWQVIQAATINPIKILGKENKFGSVSKGKMADMILLDENPIDSLTNLSKISIVFKKGQPLLPDTMINTTPEMIVQYQLNACNANNMAAFLGYYADDVELFNFPNSAIGKGKKALEELYAPFLNGQSNTHYQLLSRSVSKNIVSDTLKIKVGSNKSATEQTIIYEVENAKIRRLYFKK